ncbi:hypothetical protein BURMUCGD1_3473 [Burkholderia multivorans CGD1]|nr:hypothetical protein BURMUCGD1_3473 [Burkholderia multivorans CGD1]
MTRQSPPSLHLQRRAPRRGKRGVIALPKRPRARHRHQSQCR